MAGLPWTIPFEEVSQYIAGTGSIIERTALAVG